MTHQVKEMVEGVARDFEGFKSRQDQALSDLDERVKRAETLAARKVGMTVDSGAGMGPETKAVREWLRGGDFDRKALSIEDDGQGVTVRSDWADQIFKKIRESSPVRQVANNLSTNSNELEVLVDRGEPDSAWVAEKGDRDPTAASFMSRHKIAVHEHYSYPSVTQQFLEDSRLDLEQWLQDKIGTRFGRQEAESFIKGDGNGKPRGILDYDTVPDGDFEWGADPADYTIGAIYTGESGDFPSNNPDNVLYDVVDALKSDYLGNARFMMSRATMNKIRKLRDGDDRALLQMSLAEGRPNTLLGFPVVIAEDMPDPAADSESILFGDFGQAYTIVDRIGVSVLRDPYTLPGWVRWYVRKRIGGALTNPEALKAVVFGSEPS
ncbi:phage major capsid protein [Alkalilimnicola ehrlichii MLHE-1]|uniref:Phage major capsid protein, HK97 family n=1 Tax=Alkalilimnicola ehrlichii (strain ATCC BAA-1101 / DSM 17681 / MLHE-1) TaxID=187272 RepID=Q0AAI8_ALKEH|nr:phage major capsid protein [Alkalilimnicola ehrlichii]ABI56149.1 phage major capsid protein, HK97 family [Alkalilimnicola ehrlichii MLHE-1]